MYEKYIKRIFDIVISLFVLIIFSPVYLVIAVIIKIKLGSPIIFSQERPGKNEKIFKLYKFRTMSNKKDKNGNFLKDIERITPFGKFLRNYSLDELPELINILKGDMSLVGPRPLLVEYLKYYTKEEKKRHNARPGLTGLAQVNGRNVVKWEERLKYDIEYIENISFRQDVKIILKTILKVIKKEDVLIREDNPMKDLNEERKLDVKIKKMNLKEIENNQIKLKEYLDSLLNIASITSNKEDIFQNMIKFSKDKTANILGAYINNELIGFIWSYKRNDKLHINYFYVEEEYRSKGVGKDLINKTYKIARQNNIDKIELMVHIKNENAIKFYEKQNFTKEMMYLCKKI